MLRRVLLAASLALALALPAEAGLWFQPAGGPSGAIVNGLAADGATLWAASARGVWRYAAGTWTLDGLGDRPVTSVAVSGGVVWAATGDALFRRAADGSWSAETLPSTSALPSVLAADGDTLYAGGLGVFRRSGGSWSALASPGTGLVTAMAADPAGLLVGLSTSAVARLSGSAFTPVGSFLGAAEPIQALLVVGGTIYAGTTRALYAWSGASWTPDAALAVHDIRAITNLGGTLRVATYDAGVQRKSGATWSADRSGLLTYRTTAFAVLGSDLYAGTGGGPVYRYAGASWVAAGDAGSLQGTEVTDVIQDPGVSGGANALLATRGAGLALSVPVPDGCGDVLALAPAADGSGSNLLLAAACGALVGRTGFASASAGLPSGALVTTLTETPNGIAGGTSGAGVYRFLGSSWSADNSGLSSSAQVGTIRQVGWNLFAFVNGRLALRGTNGTWDDAGQGLPPGAIVAALGGTTDFGFAGLAAGGVYRRDSGGDWHPDSAGLLSNAVSSLDVVAGRLHAAAGTAGILVRTEGGFRPENSGLPAGTDARVVRAATIGIASLRPSAPYVFAGTSGRGAYYACAASTVKTVPVVLDVVGGTGARFRTELTLGNRSSTATSVVVSFTPAQGFGAGTVSGTTVGFSLAGNAELRAADALEFLRSKGMSIPPATPSAPIAGTLSIQGTLAGLSSPAHTEAIYAIARTYTTGAAGGTYGLFYDAPGDLDTAEESAGVYGLRTVSGSARSNLALVHVPGRSGDPITLSVQVYAENGTTAGSPIVKTLAPGEWIQLNGILDLAGLHDGSYGYAKITRTAGVGSWIAYGVVNDAATSDGSYLRMQRPGGLAAARRQIVPVVLDLNGAGGSHYTTELTLVNDGPVATPVDLTYQPAPGFSVTGTTTIGVNVGARSQVTLADVLQTFRDHGVGIPRAQDGGSVGTLAVEFRNLVNLDVGATLALARTTTPNTDTATGGAFGLFYPAVARGGGARASAVVPSLRQDAAARSNLAVVHVRGGSDLPMGLSVRLYDAETGSAVGSAITATLQPGEWKQWSSVMTTAGVPASVTKAYAVVTRTSGDDSFFAYGVQNDAVTSDGSYLAMIPADRL